MIPIKRLTTYIIAIIMLAFTTVGLIAWRALKPLSEKNGFLRSFSSTPVLITKIDLPNDVTELIDGNVASLIFQTKVPGKLWEYNTSTNKQDYNTIPLPLVKQMEAGFKTYLDTSGIQVIGLSNRTSIKAGINGNNASTFRFPPAICSRVVKINKDEYIFRGLEKRQQQINQVFFKGNSKTGKITLEPNPIFDKTGDGGMLTDGSLAYDETNKQLIYTLFYKNQFIVFDTSFQVLYRHRTIDTFSVNATQIANVNSGQHEQTITNNTPKRQINGFCEVCQGKLYILSKVKADNENSTDNRKHTVIDIYNLKDGSYLNSLYLPHYDNETVRKIKITGNSIIAIYQTQCALFQI